MNERFTQLAEEATYEMEFGGDVLQTTNDEFSYEIPAGFIEAFAKLIVRECAEIAKLNTRVDSKVNEMIKQHFGVEE